MRFGGITAEVRTFELETVKLGLERKKPTGS